jgi:tetratricopeptide (TPR) repeat protein
MRALGVDLRLESRAALTALGEFARVHDLLTEAEAVARTLPDEGRLGHVRAYQASYYRQRGDHARALEAGQHALQIGEKRHDVALRVTAGIYLGHTHYDVGDYRDASDRFRGVVAMLGEAHRLERFGLPYIPSVHARTWAALSLGEQGQFDEALAHAHAALAIAETTDHPTTLASAHMGLGRTLHRAGRVVEAIPVLERALELARAHKIQLLLAGIAESLGLAYAAIGSIEEGVKLLEEALHIHAATRGTSGQAWRAASLSQGYLLAGRVEDAMRLGRQALELAEAHGERGLKVYALAALAAAARAEGPPGTAAAERWRADADDLARELGMHAVVFVTRSESDVRRSGSSPDSPQTPSSSGSR